MTAAELMAQLQSDPEFVARQQKKELELKERRRCLRIEEEPILVDLRKVGLDIESVWDLVNTSSKYTEAIPTLIKHLILPYQDVIRGGIARSLAVPEAKSIWRTLVNEYKKEPTGGSGLGAKEGLACALSATVTEDTLSEYIDLIKDKSHGESRGLLLSELKKRRKKNPVVAQVIEELENDPDLKIEISSWKK